VLCGSDAHRIIRLPRARWVSTMNTTLTSVAKHEEIVAPVAHTALGDLRGIFKDGIAAFYGVPYAAPPIGDLRFAASAPVGPWRGLRDATQHGPVAPQLPSRLAAVVGDELPSHQDENCLTLTIYTPAPDTKARPVIVWLHGGAWMAGSGSSDMYDGALLAREGDLVFVGVNYRLGVLGWLHRPGIIDVEPGISDMIIALAWVRDHIADFGGDPAQVTVMGQSAGATSIARLLMMPEARGLFLRVILQSSGLGRGFLTSAAAALIADQFLGLVDIDPDSGDALSRLRAIDVARLLRAQGELLRLNVRFAQSAPPFMPVIPYTMSQTEMLAAIADGISESKDRRKDVLIGTTADEVHAHYSVSPLMKDPPADAVVAAFGSEAKLAHYHARRPGGTALDLLADLATEEIYFRPSLHLAEKIATQGSNIYVYIFDWAPPASPFKSCHCIELPFVFGTFGAWHKAPMLAGGDAAQMADLSTAMRHAWIRFARDGIPEHEGLPPWPQYDAIRRPTLRFGARIGIVNDPAGLN